LIERGRITERTRSIRQGLLNKLETWLAEQLPDTSLELLARHHIDVLSEWLEEYMVTLYLEGASRRSAAESLNAVVQQFGWLRSSLAAPWNVLKTWDMLEPVTHHPPMPLQVVLALASTALAWNWPHFAALLVIGYFGLLRPSELVGLRRRDLSLPQDHWEPQVLYVRIGQPKTRFRAAMAQHVRIDETGVAAWVQLILGSMPMWRKLWCGSVSSFKTRLELVQQEVLQCCVFQPSSLRPGGATFLFRKFNEDLTRVQWRGRWKSYKMLETYVQELGASEIWIRFPQKIRDRVKVLGDLFLRLLHVACDARLPDTPAAMHPSPPAREG
jgi:hypothetical protein